MKKMDAMKNVYLTELCIYELIHAGTKVTVHLATLHLSAVY